MACRYHLVATSQLAGYKPTSPKNSPPAAAASIWSLWGVIRRKCVGTSYRASLNFTSYLTLATEKSPPPCEMCLTSRAR